MGLYEIFDNWFNGVYFREIPSLITSLVWNQGRTSPIIVEDPCRLWSKWIDGNFHVITLWSDNASIRFTSFEYYIFTILFSFLVCFTMILLGVCLIDYGRAPVIIPPSDQVAKMSLSPSYLSGLADLGEKEESDSDYVPTDNTDDDTADNTDDDTADNTDDDTADDTNDDTNDDFIDLDVYNFINDIDGYYCEMSDVVD
ncbi:MAG: hypothetical protein WD512_11335 [Candidatus Paceibacterota bacterium]